VRLHVAAAYQALNRLADATQIAKSLASEYPDNTFVRILLAETLARRGEADDAREQYAIALRSLTGDDDDDAARRDEIRLRIAAIDLSAIPDDAIGDVDLIRIRSDVSLRYDPATRQLVLDVDR